MILIAVLAIGSAACGSGVGDTDRTTDAGQSPTTVVDTTDSAVSPGDGAAPGTTVAEPPGVPRADPVNPPVEKGPFFLDSADVLVMESYPIQVTVVVDGSIPTPCDSAGWKVEIVGDEILVEVYSIPLNDPAASCIAQVEDVAVTVPLGSFQAGAYTVIVNGETVGSFEA